MTADQFKEFYNLHDGEPEYEDNCKIVRDGEWQQDGKRQTCDTVYRLKDADGDEQFFMVSACRTGSPFTDWEYEEPDFYQVVPKIITKTIYKVIK